MKSFQGIALVAFLLPSAAGASPNVDVYRELVRYRTNDVGVSGAFAQNTQHFVAQFLDDPGSPYSELNDFPEVANEVWWPDFAEGLPVPGPDKVASALTALQRQMGLTKARPGRDVVLDQSLIDRFHGQWKVAANAGKAGVDPDIFWHAWDMNNSLPSVAAGYAVALQILRNQIASNDPSDYGRMAIRPEVLSRYMDQRNPELISEYDQRYLASLLRYALAHPAAAIHAKNGDSLPAAYRVARVAAGYIDASYDFGYCESTDFHAMPAPDYSKPGAPTPLCLVEATDRAVQSWYRRQLRADAAGFRKDVGGESGFSHLLHIATTVLLLIDFAGFVEVIDAVVAGDLAAEGAISEADAEFAGERANRLTCRIRQ